MSEHLRNGWWTGDETETLRWAARQMRAAEDPDGSGRPASVADWLDFVAERHQRTEVYTVATLTTTQPVDDDAAFIERVQRGSDSEAVGGWKDAAVEDADGNIVASIDPPTAACTHRIQDGVWPCPEIAPALKVALDYFGWPGDLDE